MWIRTYNLVRALAEAFSIRMLCFERAITSDQGRMQDEGASVRALSELGPTEVFRIPQRHSRIRFAWDHGRSLLTRRTFTHFLYDSRPYRRRLLEILKEGGIDLVHVDSLDLCAYLPYLKGLPVACTHHNVESALLRRRAAAERSPVMRAYAGLQSRLTEDDERYWCSRVDLNVAVSPEDAAALRALAPDGRYLVVPNGVDIDLFRPADSRPAGGLVFVGAASWFPNRDGMEYFCREILSLLRRRRPDLRVTWIGAVRPADRVRMREAYGVELVGHVPDIRPYVHGAECYIVPLHVGGGSRLKILDAWAMGKAVVSTSIGCEGLAAEDGRNILIGDTPGSFAAAVERVLDNEPTRRRLGAAARRTAEQVYAWEVVARTLVDAYQEMLEERGPAGSPAAGPRLHA